MNWVLAGICGIVLLYLFVALLEPEVF